MRILVREVCDRPEILPNSQGLLLLQDQAWSRHALQPPSLGSQLAKLCHYITRAARGGLQLT